MPSWVKIVFSSEMENKRNVIISSEPDDLHPENNISNFCVELPKTIDFSLKNDPRVALTRLSFKNYWKIMSGLKLNIFIYNYGNDFEKFECPKEIGGPRNCEEIIQWCKEILDEKISVKMVKQNNGNWSIKFPSRKHIIILGRDLAQCLGLSYLHKNSGDLFTDLKKNNGGYRSISTEKHISLLVKTAIACYTHDKYRVTVNELPFQSTGDVAIYRRSPHFMISEFVIPSIS